MLLSRWPFVSMLMLFSGVFSMLLSWSCGRNPGKDAIYPPSDAYTECGTVRPEWEAEFDWFQRHSVQITSNDRWRNRIPVMYMAFGALIHGIFAFVVVRSEFKAQLLGMLRTAGLRDSVYWVAWNTVFAVISMFSSLLAAMTAKTLPGHVYENVFFVGIFLSLWCLSLSVIALSFFLVSVSGSSGRLCGLVVCLVMIKFAYIPFKVGTGSLFWDYMTTARTNACHFPIFSESQTKNSVVAPDDIFIGW